VLRAHGRGFDLHRRGDQVNVTLDAARLMVFRAEAEGERVA
jgi:hypothetical protein